MDVICKIFIKVLLFFKVNVNFQKKIWFPLISFSKKFGWYREKHGFFKFVQK